MTYEALIEEIKTLPEPQLAEVSDFVFYLKQRSESDLDIQAGLTFFENLKGSVDREINEKEELNSARDEKYAYIN